MSGYSTADVREIRREQVAKLAEVLACIDAQLTVPEVDCVAATDDEVAAR
jgi:hypothetical protein